MSRGVVKKSRHRIQGSFPKEGDPKVALVLYYDRQYGSPREGTHCFGKSPHRAAGGNDLTAGPRTLVRCPCGTELVSGSPDCVTSSGFILKDTSPKA